MTAVAYDHDPLPAGSPPVARMLLRLLGRNWRIGRLQVVMPATVDEEARGQRLAVRYGG